MRAMPPARVITAVAAAVLAAGCASTPPEQDPVQLRLNDLDARVARSEHVAANQVEVSQRLDEIQNNLRELRGRVDELEHASDALTKQQRDLYADLNKRISAAGGTAPGSAGSGGGATPEAGSADTGAAAAAGGAAAGGTAPAAGTAGGNSPSSVEQAVYSEAFDALKAGSYSVAVTGFKNFLATYPSSPLADNAQYWLGEAYYVNHDYDSAGEAFRTVLKKWPDARKAPDALLKLGYTQVEQRQYAAARSTLTAVTQKYPGTDSAKLAADKLRHLPAQ